MQESKWASTVVLVDADYLDSVAQDLTVNFGRMLNREIAEGDLCHWLDCVALDGGLRQKRMMCRCIFCIQKRKRLLHILNLRFLRKI